MISDHFFHYCLSLPRDFSLVLTDGNLSCSGFQNCHVLYSKLSTKALYKKQFLGSDSEQLIIVCPEQLSNQGPEKGKKSFPVRKEKSLLDTRLFFHWKTVKEKNGMGNKMTRCILENQIRGLEISLNIFYVGKSFF